MAMNFSNFASMAQNNGSEADLSRLQNWLTAGSTPMQTATPAMDMGSTEMGKMAKEYILKSLVQPTIEAQGLAPNGQPMAPGPMPYLQNQNVPSPEMEQARQFILRSILGQ